ncbi:zinc finger CCCH domain-containing protein 62-like isoform X1 [Macadamia integrifolia]|uniref:zinc finger CCCH domain-containing protein 62-like isoform X1 n=1 Tax=Macadamia integrifolia TaxID=60698 RepID=UPI001C4E9B60|nr:zinc finger CCCH domain-containing protein 62-like isoform X1 [Macadamia integrifolia]
MAGKKGKQAVICLSSSSESGEESEEEEVEEEDDDDNDVEDEEETSSQSCSDEGSDWSGEGSDWSDEEEAGSESLEDGDDDEDGSESTKPVDIEASCNRVINLLKADQIFEIPHDSPNAYVGGADLQELKLEECKAYLRKHSLRLTGNKAVCVQRIQEHWRSDFLCRNICF